MRKHVTDLAGNTKGQLLPVSLSKISSIEHGKMTVATEAALLVRQRGGVQELLEKLGNLLVFLDKETRGTVALVTKIQVILISLFSNVAQFPSFKALAL